MTGSPPLNHLQQAHNAPSHSNGNILFAILIAIVLMAGLSVVVSDGLSGGKGTSDEEMQAKAESMIRYAKSVHDAVQLMYTTTDMSETDFLFAHPKNHSDYGNNVNATPEHQVFSPDGGGANFLYPIPEGINDGSAWTFHSNSRANEVGDPDEPDLMIVLPNVTDRFCKAVNKTRGYTDADDIPLDASGCGFLGIKKWDNTYPSGGSYNGFGTVNIKTPASYLCLQCEANGINYFYYVLLAR